MAGGASLDRSDALSKRRRPVVGAGVGQVGRWKRSKPLKDTGALLKMCSDDSQIFSFFGFPPQKQQQTVGSIKRFGNVCGHLGGKSWGIARSPDPGEN